MIHQVAFIVAFSAATAAAQSSTVVDLMLPGYDPHPYVGSIVSASPAITTYAMQCADSVDELECGLLYGNTIAQGPSTWSMHYSHSDSGSGSGSFEQDMSCKIDRKKDSIHCEVKMLAWSEDGDTVTQSTVAATSGLSALFFPVTITAGLEKLEAVPGSTGGVSAATETETATSTTKDARPNPSATESDSGPADASESVEEDTSSFPTPTSSATDVEEEADSTSTNSDNAAFPRATQNAFLAGVAVVVGGALMM